MTNLFYEILDQNGERTFGGGSMYSHPKEVYLANGKLHAYVDSKDSQVVVESHPDIVAKGTTGSFVLNPGEKGVVQLAESSGQSVRIHATE